MSVRLSILMAVRNGGPYLAATFDRVFATLSANTEVIAVDDGSTDGSREVLDRYPLRLCRLQPGRGLAAARNEAVRLARGEFLAFLDQDDWPVDGGFSRQLEFLERRPELPAVVGEIAGVIDGEGRYLGDFYELTGKCRPAGSITWEALRAGGYLPGAIWLYLFRAGFFRELGPLDPGWGELCDQDLLYRAVRRSPIPCSGIPVAWYRVHGANSTVHLGHGDVRARPRAKALGVLLAMRYGLTLQG